MLTTTTLLATLLTSTTPTPCQDFTDKPVLLQRDDESLTLCSVVPAVYVTLGFAVDQALQRNVDRALELCPNALRSAPPAITLPSWHAVKVVETFGCPL